MECPISTHKIAPSCRAISNPIYLPHPWTQPTYHPKQHPDPVRRFSTIHTDKQTDQPTGGLGDIISTKTHLRSIDLIVATWLIIRKLKIILKQLTNFIILFVLKIILSFNNKCIHPSYTWTRKCTSHNGCCPLVS